SSNGPSKRKTLPKSNGPQFTIPRLKKIKRDLLTELPLDSRECQNDILAPLRKSFHFHASNSSHEFLRVQSVHNPEQVEKYLEKRKDMKSNGYSDSFISDTIAFVPIENTSQIEQLCKDGIKCGNQKFSGLGVPHMAVHVCKHADIISPMKPKAGEKVLIAVKVIKGKVKTVMCRGVGCDLEPTPNYDCHIAKSNLDQPASQSPHLQSCTQFTENINIFLLLFTFSLQLYLYEYGDFDVEDYPRQVLPFAVIYYCVKEPQQIVPKSIIGSPHKMLSPALVSGAPGTMAWQGQSSVSSPEVGFGPTNEVWRGRLHVRLIEGGHIYIEVSMLSYYVPLTVNMGHSTPVLRGARGSRGRTSASDAKGLEFESWLVRYLLVGSVSMPTVRLPNDVFLFLMPNCLLASQLGLVRMEDSSPVIHCVLMSKFSTSEAQKKKLAVKKCPLPNLGTATSWEELFDDSDTSDDEATEADPTAPVRKTQDRLAQILPGMFKDQRSIQNKFAAMSLSDAEANLSQCSCRTFSQSKAYRQKCRDAAVQNIFGALQSIAQPSKKVAAPEAVSHFPPGSRRKPKPKLSHRTKNMPSFSPHGSSESESDSDNGHRTSRKSKSHLSILHSTKTVEEELSEEELTNEQMEDIIFMRKKPAHTAFTSKSSRIKEEATFAPKLKTQSWQKETSVVIPPQKPQTSPLSPVAHLSNQRFDAEFDKRVYKEPSFSTKPKIIPIEPVEEPTISTLNNSPTSMDISFSLCNASPPKTGILKSSTKQEKDSNTSIAPEKAETGNKNVPVLPKSSLTDKNSSLVDQHPKVKNHRCEVSANAPLSLPKATKQHELNLSLSASTPQISSDLPISSAKNSPPQTSSSIPSSKASSLTGNLRRGSGELKKSLSPALPLPSSVQPEPQQLSHDALDYGDVDMRVPSHRCNSVNPVFLSTPEQEDVSSPQRDQSQRPSSPNSPNLSFGMWLAPSDIVVPMQPPPFPEGLLGGPVASPPFSMPKSPSPPCSPISLPANSPPSPMDSPASPPAESPASPASPSPPAEPDLESPMSPPRSSTFSTLRSTPIAIPTSRLEHQTASPEINYLQRQSPFVARSLNVQAYPGASSSGIDNADDMKDFLNGGFNSDLDSSYEDESLTELC
ncbi:hypothetical protein EGW08_015122, partial [Elysia chlorotica]